MTRVRSDEARAVLGGAIFWRTIFRWTTFWRATFWRTSMDVAAHIARRQPERAQARNLEVREVLTHAVALLEHVGDRRGH